MKSDWQETTLGAIAEIIMGQSPQGQTCNTEGYGIPLLNGPSEFGPCHPIPVQYTVDPKKIAHGEDLLFCVRGSTTGRMNWANQEYAIGRGLATLRHKKGKEYHPYLKGLIEIILPTLLKSATGSTFPNLSRNQLENHKIYIPDEKTQLLISKIISSLDNKIELNRQMCKTLEDIASTLFKSWFIDFDPVKAKAEGRAPKELSPEIADLFPDSFLESSFGPIPKGWKVQSLDQLADISIGRTPPRKENEWFSLCLTDNKWISIRDLGHASMFVTQSSEFITNKAVQKFKIPEIPPNTIVISFKLTVGRIAITTERMYSNEAIAHCQNLKIAHEFLYLFLKNYNFDILGNTSSIGTAVNSKSIKSINVLVPDGTILSKIKDVFDPIFKKVLCLVKENATLSDLRDKILPRLISGTLSFEAFKDL